MHGVKLSDVITTADAIHHEVTRDGRNKKQMKSFKSHDKSNVTFKFLFTGLTALSLLFVIGVVFLGWYYVR